MRCSCFVLTCSHLFFVAAIDLREASNDTITSPGFPGKYPRNSHFVWSLVAPSGYRLKIEFTKFDIFDEGGYDCPKDALVVRDGPSVQSELLTRLCGRYTDIHIPQAIYSSTNFMTLEFVSEVYGMHRDYVGFKANVTKGKKIKVQSPKCLTIYRSLPNNTCTNFSFSLGGCLT